MPIYEYKCQDCGEISEFLAPTHSESYTFACTRCGSSHLEKLISAPSLLRTGTGSGGNTCCGRDERCEKPPCSTGDRCRRA